MNRFPSQAQRVALLSRGTSSPPSLLSLIHEKVRLAAISAVLLLVPIALVVASYVEGTRVFDEVGSVDGILYVPSGDAFKLASAGHGTFLSSLLWTRAMFYYADAIVGTGSSAHMEAILRAVVTLDPDWKYPYEFAGLVLEQDDGRASPQAIGFLRDGMRRFPGDWRLRLYLAMTLQGRGDLSDIERILLPITRGDIPAPEYVRTMVFTMLENHGETARMVTLISQLAATVDDPMVAVSIQDKIARFVQGHADGLVSDPDSVAKALLALFRQGQAALAERVLLDIASDAEHLQAAALANDLARQYQDQIPGKK